MKVLLSWLLSVGVLLQLLSPSVQLVRAAQVETESPSVILMEVTTGTVLAEKNAQEQRSPASITKIMTLLLIFEELEKGTLHLEDEVITSAHAKSMGGSQVYLEEGEKQTVETMIKCMWWLPGTMLRWQWQSI